MKIYWTSKSIPELADLPPAERRAQWRRCAWLSLRRWPVILTMLIGGACIGLAMYLTAITWPGLYILYPIFAAGIGGVYGGVFGQVVACQVRRILQEEAGVVKELQKN